MKATSNSYIGGMHKDNSPIKVDGMYPYHLENVRLFTESGNTTLTIENILGNTQCTITNISDFDYSDYSIAGHCNYGKDIILFYHGDYYTSSVARYGAISLLKYRTDGHYYQIDLYHTTTTNNWKLIPNEPINCFVNYETEYIQKVYWWTSQGYFHLNFAPNTGTDGSLNDHYSTCRDTAYNKLLSVPFIKFATPEFVSYESGQLVEGSVQYAYRLYNLNGNISNISPCSRQIPVSNYITITSSRRFRGADGLHPDTVSSIGVRININLNSAYPDYNKYDRIEVFRLHNNAKESIPTINSIYKGPVQAQVNVLDDGINNYGTFTYTEFITWQSEYTFITSAIKENRVFIGNINEEYFDVDVEANWYNKPIGIDSEFDTRMYRFGKATSVPTFGKAYIQRYDNNGNLVTDIIDSSLQIDADGDGIWESVPNTHDAINPFNNVEDDTSRTNDGLFKYRSDGTTLGGEGVNGSYTFMYYDYLIDEITNPRALNVSINDTSTNVNIQANKDWILGLKRGFQRDEIYRFGIVFFDKKGRRSFVKWIGDIRMPSILDSTICYSANDGSGMYARTVVPVFDFSVLPTIDGELLDYQIVYVERTNADKTVIAQGFGCGVEDSYGGDGNFSAIALLDPTKAGNVTKNGHTGYRNGNLKWLGEYNIMEFNSPDTIMDDNNHTPRTNRIDLVGYWQGQNLSDFGIVPETSYIFRETYPGSGVGAGPDSVGERQLTMKMRTVNGIVPLTKTVEDIRFPAFNEKITINSKGYTQYGDNDTHYTDVSYKTRSNVVALTSTFTIPSDYNYHHGLFNLRRFSTQYNGNKYTDRLLNTYIEASDLNSTICTKGDTFIAYFDYLRAAWNISDTHGDGGVGAQEVIYFPVESSINLFMRTDMSQHRNMSIDMPNPSAELYDASLEGDYVYYSDDNYYYYDDVHSKPYSINTFLPKPLDYRSNSQFRHQIRWTDKKLQGEETDRWLQFRSNNYYNAESLYGPINRLQDFRNEIILFHDNALGVLQISPQTTQTDNLGAAVVLGTGETLQRINYVSTECGLQKTLYEVNRVVISPSYVYWVDTIRRKLYRYNLSQLQSLSDLKGFEGYFRRGIDEKSEILGTYDAKYSEVVITVRHPDVKTATFTEIVPPSTTITFNEITEGSYIDLNLGTGRNKFTCTTATQNNNNFIKGASVESTVANFISSIQGCLASNGLSDSYVIKQDGIKVIITGIGDVADFNTDIYLNTKILDSQTQSFTGGAADIYISTAINITEENSVVLINPGEPGFPDKFEIWKKGLTDSDYVQVATSWCGADTEFDGINGNTSTNYGTTSLGGANKEFYLNWLKRNGGTTVNGVPVATRTNLLITDDESDRLIVDNPPSPLGPTTPTLVSVFPTQNVTALFSYPKFAATMIECYCDAGEGFYLGYDNYNSRVAPMFSTREDAFKADTGIQDTVPYRVSRNYYSIGNCTVPPIAPMTGIGNGQFIWYKAQVGDEVKIKVTGSVTQYYTGGVAKGTGWSYNLWVLQQQSASIDSVEEVKKSESINYYRKSYSSIIDTQVIYDKIITVEDTAYFDMEEGGIYNIDGSNYTVDTKTATAFTMDKVLSTNKPDLSRYAIVNNNFTLCFSEKLDAFTSFYSFLPDRYIKVENSYLTTINKKDLWIHNYEDRCSFYDTVKEVRIEFMTNAEQNNTDKEWNNLSWYSEVFDNNRKLLHNLTLTSMRCRNAYQQTEEIIFIPYDETTAYPQVLWNDGTAIPTLYGDGTYTLVNVRRTVDNWRCAFPRIKEVIGDAGGHIADYIDSGYIDTGYDTTDVAPNEDNVSEFRNRIRSPYTKLTFYFTSTANRKLVLHDIISYFENLYT